MVYIKQRDYKEVAKRFRSCYKKLTCEWYYSFSVAEDICSNETGQS